MLQIIISFSSSAQHTLIYENFLKQLAFLVPSVTYCEKDKLFQANV